MFFFFNFSTHRIYVVVFFFCFFYFYFLHLFRISSILLIFISLISWSFDRFEYEINWIETEINDVIRLRIPFLSLSLLCSTAEYFIGLRFALFIELSAKLICRFGCTKASLILDKSWTTYCHNSFSGCAFFCLSFSFYAMHKDVNFCQLEPTRWRKRRKNTNFKSENKKQKM